MPSLSRPSGHRAHFDHDHRLVHEINRRSERAREQSGMIEKCARKRAPTGKRGPNDLQGSGSWMPAAVVWKNRPGQPNGFLI